MTPKKWEELVEQTFQEVLNLSRLKGHEYSGDQDRLANFRRNAADCGINMETCWRVYAGKHWDAVGQYIKDLNDEEVRVRLEPIDGRVDDLIVYLLLFKAMLVERSTEPLPVRPERAAPKRRAWDGDQIPTAEG